MDKQQLRQVLSLLPYGVYVVTSRDGERHVTMLATWISQVSFRPPLIALSLESDSQMLRTIRTHGIFSVNLLPEGGKELAASFLKPAESRENLVAGHPFTLAAHGSCILTEASGALECRAAQEVPAGDHTIVLGEVIDAVPLGGGDPLTLRDTGWKYQK
jgi:flavin reductase (DIM6/NTAB) family NADH-FMN oxidoreductase RutF